MWLSIDIKKIILPTYNEITLFNWAITFALILLFSADVRSSIISFIQIPIDVQYRLAVYLFLLCFFLGMVLSFINVFLKRKISAIEKYLMFFFAVPLIFVVGLIVPFEAVLYAEGYYKIFAYWNLMNIVIFLLYIKGNKGNKDIEEYVIFNDCQASYLQIIVGLLAVVIIFYYSSNILNNSWYVTISICSLYATNVNNFITNVLSSS